MTIKETTEDDKLFDAILKVAAEEALIQDIEEMPSCEEANKLYKLSPNSDKKIRKIISQHKRKEEFYLWRKTALKVAAAFAIFTLVSSTILFSVEATRNFILNKIIEWQDDYFSLEHTDIPTEKLTIITPTYLPDGFNKVSSDNVGDINTIIYRNKFGAKIILTQSMAQMSNTLSDYDDKNFSIIEINKSEAYFIKANNTEESNIILWESEGFIFSIMSKIDSQELILMAESIKK